MSEINVEKIIREAMQEGKFDRIEGKGKPLHLNPHDDLVNLAVRMVKEAGFVPEWVELAKQIDAAMRGCQKLLENYAARRGGRLESLRAMLEPPPQAAPEPKRGLLGRLKSSRMSQPPNRLTTSLVQAVAQFNQDWERTLAAYCAELHGVNKMIDRFNHLVPLRDKQKAKVSVKEAATAFVARFSKLSPLTESARPLRFVEGAVDAQLLQPPKEETPAAGKPRGRLQAEALERYVKMRQPPRR